MNTNSIINVSFGVNEFQDKHSFIYTFIIHSLIAHVQTKRN